MAKRFYEDVPCSVHVDEMEMDQSLVVKVIYEEEPRPDWNAGNDSCLFPADEGTKAQLKQCSLGVREKTWSYLHDPDSKLCYAEEHI